MYELIHIIYIEPPNAAWRIFMKKWNKVIAMMLTTIAIAVMLPMGSVQALKKIPVMELEVETEQEDETNQKIETEPESKAETESESEAEMESAIEVQEERKSEPEPASEMETIEEESEQIINSAESENRFSPTGNAKKIEWQIAQAAQGISVKIEDDIQKDLTYEANQCVKKAVHTIKLTRNEKILSLIEPFSTTKNIYESISYMIYRKTDEGEICLEEGSLKIPNKNDNYSINEIETAYTQAGDYSIRVKGRWKQEIEVELACYHFSIEKKMQKISLKQNTQELNYGEIIYIDDLLDVNSSYSYQKEYEITEKSGEKNKILEIREQDKSVYLKAVGLNAIDEGRTTVTIRAKDNAFMKASNEETLTVIVHPVELTITAQMNVPEVYMYDSIAVEVQLQKDGKDVMGELLEEEKHLFVNFAIKSNKHLYEISSKELELEQSSPYIFNIPVKKEYFQDFSKGASYKIEISLKYDGEIEYPPYKANTVTKGVRLLGRRAVVELSAEQGGVYDYRTYYGGTQPCLFIAIKDTTKDTTIFESPIEAEAGEIVYRITSRDCNVASIDGSKQYTAKDQRIPISINGVGTTTFTITANRNSVYTVKSSSITITVKDSPLYDEDFVICVANEDTSELQSFVSDAKQTGFEKWQEYLTKHNGWLNRNVQICLTELGLEYYDLLKLSENGNPTNASEQLCIDSDREKTSYELWAENSNTKANTKNAEDKEKSVRSFELGIDTIAPMVTQLIPSTDYYNLTSTADKQCFANNFVLKGSFKDNMSGIAAIEYTTNINAQNGAEWFLLESETDHDNRSFELILGNGIYPAIAVRAIDAAGNISELACVKNEAGEFIKIIVNNIPPEIDVSVMRKDPTDTWQTYSAEGENWTNREIRFQVFEKENSLASLYKVEYAYQSIAAALNKEPIDDGEWTELIVNEQGAAELSIGGDSKNPSNKNGYYYFRGISESGVKSKTMIEKRILLWQRMEDKKPVIESGVDHEKCHDAWYNKASGTPVIDFEYPKYDTGVISGEYAAPITIHYNLTVKDEKDVNSSLADDKTASIHVDFSQSISPTDVPVLYDDLSQLQIKLSDDGIYTLEYWTTDAAGNKSETETFMYKIDCHEPTELKLVLNSEEQFIGKEDMLLYDKFYQNSISGGVMAAYGISGKGSIKLLKAKRIGEWKEVLPTEDAEQFQLEPNMRCLLYIRAVDGAGNMTEGWTRGIVVDHEAPTGDGIPQLIVEPKGANKHGFFNKDPKVTISVKDAPYDGNSAGLKLVKASVGTDEGNTILDKEIFSSVEEQVTENLMRETESFHILETIDAKANEGNHAYITVNATDRSGNISTSTQELKIDVTKPEIEITFDNENALNGRYYNTDRRAKIMIKELNFDASLVKINVTKNGAAFTPSISKWESDKASHFVYVDFSADGDYTLTVECKDLADNEAEKKSVEPFTIDKTMPRVEITLENDRAQNKHFNETQIVTFTVTEHNFNVDNFHINIQPSGKLSSWEHKNDTHVIKAELALEGEYEISCDYKDLAGNEISVEDKAKMPLELVIDKTEPVIEISGVEDNSANAKAVIPNIAVRDTNINPISVTITLTTGRGVAIDIYSDLTTAHTDGGFLYTLNGLDTKQDDIYYLTVNAADMAGNISELTYRFSLNRRGSAYDLTALTTFKDRYYNSYRDLEDIKIIEMNVDRVEEFALYLSYNADIIYGKSGSRPLSQNEAVLQEAVLYNVDISGNEDTGYVYTYTVYRENFAREGTYRFGIYSKDRAGNEVNNLLEQNGEEIQFVIDNTIPRVVIDGVENNEIYDVSSQEVYVVADDNFKLAEAELTLVNKAGEVLERWNYFDLVEKEGDTALITIKEHNEEVSLLYRAVDAAGNEVRTLQGEKEAKADFLVTTDKLVQLVNKPAKTPIGCGIVIVLIGSMLGVALIFVLLIKAFLKKRK